jgi:hypothetical protein
VTVDRELVRAASSAVRAGRADSLSGWVNLALTDRAAKEQRLEALADAIRAYEAEFGVISAAELSAQRKADRRTATLVQGARVQGSPSPARARTAARRRGAA